MRNGSLIGYARASTQDQDLALQIDAMNQVGCAYERAKRLGPAKKGGIRSA